MTGPSAHAPANSNLAWVATEPGTDGLCGVALTIGTPLVSYAVLFDPVQLLELLPHFANNGEDTCRAVNYRNKRTQSGIVVADATTLTDILKGPH